MFKSNKILLIGSFLTVLEIPAFAFEKPPTAPEPGVYFTNLSSTYCMQTVAIGSTRIDKLAEPNQTIIDSYADLGLKSSNLPAAITVSSLRSDCSSGYIYAQISYGVVIHSNGSYEIQNSTCNKGNCSIFSVSKYPGTQFPEFKSK